MANFFKTISISFIVFSCSSSGNQSENGGEDKTSDASDEISVETVDSDEGSELYLAFSKIDNRVIVQMDDSIVYDSKTIGGNPELDFRVDLADFYKAGMSELKVDLYNGIEPYDNQADTYWQVVYDLYMGDEILEFVAESGGDGRIGIVFSETYQLDEY